MTNLHLRSIDNILLIRTDPWRVQQIQRGKINTVPLLVKLDFNVSKLGFLDFSINKATTGTLQITFDKKPMERKVFHHLKSEHPKSLKSSINFAQA